MITIADDNLLVAVKDSSPLVIPPEAVGSFIEWLRKAEHNDKITPNDLRERKAEDLEARFIDFVVEFAKEHDGKITPKAVGNFIVKHILSCVPTPWASSIEKRATIEAGPDRFEIVAFGWNIGTAYEEPYLFIFKNDN